jgi:hypothetical protein
MSKFKHQKNTLSARSNDSQRYLTADYDQPNIDITKEVYGKSKGASKIKLEGGSYKVIVPKSESKREGHKQQNNYSSLLSISENAVEKSSR